MRKISCFVLYGRHWRDFLHRWKKGEEGNPGVNHSEKVTDSTELYETLAKEELAEISAAQDPEVNKAESESEHIGDSMWLNFKDRWTKDSQMKGHVKESSSKSERCASGDPAKRKDLTKYFGNFVNSVMSPKAVPERRAAIKTQSFVEYRRQSDSEKNSEEIFQTRPADFKEGVPFENPLFPNGVFSSSIRWRRLYGKTDPKTGLKRADNMKVYPKALQIFRGLAHLFIAPENTKGVCQRIESYKELVLRKCAKETVVQVHGPERRSEPFRKQETAVDGNQTLIFSQGRFLTKEKQKLRNLSKLRGEEIRKQRIQRREWKKKQREAESRRKVAKRLLSELRREKLRVKEEKKKLRRSWKKLKREKKKIHLEGERHKKDMEKLKNVMTLREEKQKLKRQKVQLNEKVKKLLSKERENLKVREKALDAQKKKEVERLKNEISKEKNRLQQQRKEVKSLQKAAKKKYNKWLNELRKIKRQEQEKREAKQAKRKEKERKKREKLEREMRRRREYESVVREQAKYEKEKRNRKGEYGDHAVTRNEWKKTDNNLKQDESHQRKFREDSEKKEKNSDPGESFRQQLENVKQWLSDVHKATIERHQIYWSGTLIRPILNAISGRAYRSEPNGEEPLDVKDKESKRRNTDSAEGKANKQSSDRGDTAGRSQWENQRIEIRKILSKMEKRGCELKENEKREMAVSKTEVAKISDDKALMGVTNLTFGADFVKMLLKGIDKQNRNHKVARDSEGAAESGTFIMVTDDSDDHDSSVGLNDERKKSGRKRQRSDRKPKRPNDRLRGRQNWSDKNVDTAKRPKKSPQGPITSEDSQLAEDQYEHPSTVHNVRYKLSSQGPTPPSDIGLSLQERYEKRSKVPKNRRKPLTPQGPIPSEEVHQGHSGKGKKRKRTRRSEIQEKVCRSDNPEKREPIPPPDWVFERAKGRTHQRSAPWYVRRAEDRKFQRSVDKHDSQFPCGRKRKHYKGPLNPSWIFDRADYREFQRLNNVPWYTRRAEGRETERKKGQDSWFVERGFYRSYLRDQTWMPRGPSLEEHR